MNEPHYRSMRNARRSERDPLCTGLLIFAAIGLAFQLVRWALTQI